MSKRRVEDGRAYRGVNFFDADDLRILEAIGNQSFAITGFQNANIRPLLGRPSAWISRQLKRLRKLGLIKRVARRYKYYLTALGKQVIAAGLRLRREFLEPALADLPTAM